MILTHSCSSEQKWLQFSSSSSYPQQHPDQSSQSFSSAAKSSRASENSPSSKPSPTYQCTKALFAYIKSNLWLIYAYICAIELQLVIRVIVLALRSNEWLLWLLFTACWFQYILKPVGTQSNMFMVGLLASISLLRVFRSHSAPRRKSEQLIYLDQPSLWDALGVSHFPRSNTQFSILAGLASSLLQQQLFLS